MAEHGSVSEYKKKIEAAQEATKPGVVQGLPTGSQEPATTKPPAAADGHKDEYMEKAEAGHKKSGGRPWTPSERKAASDFYDKHMR